MVQPHTLLSGQVGVLSVVGAAGLEWSSSNNERQELHRSSWCITSEAHAWKALLHALHIPAHLLTLPVTTVKRNFDRVTAAHQGCTKQGATMNLDTNQYTDVPGGGRVPYVPSQCMFLYLEYYNVRNRNVEDTDASSTYCIEVLIIEICSGRIWHRSALAAVPQADP